MSGTLSLDRSLRMEWGLGFIGLSDTVKMMLPKNIAKVVDGTVEERKGWFFLVRKAREYIGDARTADAFSNPKSSLRILIGL